MNVFIYGLTDPDTKAIRYLGKAGAPRPRYEEHLKYSSRDKTHKGHWIRALLAEGKRPALEILDEVPEKEWEFWEREYIRWGRAMQFRLTNGTDGGEGVRPTLETRAKQRAASMGNQSNLGKTLSPAHRAKVSAALMGHVVRPETREKLRAAQMGNKSCLGRKASVETRAKLRAASLRNKSSI